MDLLNIYTLEQRTQQRMAALAETARRERCLREARRLRRVNGAHAPIWARLLTAMLFWSAGR